MIGLDKETGVVKARSQRGTSLLEFAVVLPLLVLIMAGVADLGRAFNTYIAITNATREGARYGARMPWSTSAIISATTTELQNAGISASYTVSIQCRAWSSSGTGAVINCINSKGGDFILVSARYTGFKLLFGSIATRPPVPISARTKMVIQGFTRGS